MYKLIPFELGKIWRKKNFIAFTAILLVLNVFMLWYNNAPRDDYSAPLAAYKAVSRDLSGKSAEERREFLEQKKELLDNIEIVERYIVMSRYDFSDREPEEKEYYEQGLKEYAKVYDEYKDIYNSGEYLSYTKNLRSEKEFINEIFAEYDTVAGYDDYIKSIEDNKNRLSGISIFGSSGVDKNTFSARNIEKSYLDHKDLTSENVGFAPSKGVKIASENMLTDLLLLLSIMLFVGSLISEEKEKGLFYITRATHGGIAASISAKLFALLIHSAAVVFLLYGSNYLFAEISAGAGDLNSAIQSVSIFQESSLEITLGEYYLLGAATKIVLLFAFGAAASAAAIVLKKSFIPLLCGVGFLGISYLAFKFIPAYSRFNIVKYLSFWGIFNPKYIYGEYLNFNVGGYPFARIRGAVIVISAGFLISAAVCVLLFVNAKNLDIKRFVLRIRLPFKYHKSLFLHESCKILFTNKAIIVFLVFGFLIAYNGLQKSYYPTVGEQYYAGVMHKLEGGLTPEKEEYVIAEKERFDNAFKQLEAIKKMQADGEIDDYAARSMRSVWEAQTALYPYFQRVESRYDTIKASGGEFVYDTGYKFLFAKIGGGYLTEMLGQIICVIFAFSGVMSMESRKKSWNLLSATAVGKKRIILHKSLCCGVLCAISGAFPWIFRIITITEHFSLNYAQASIKNLQMYENLPIGIPIWLFVVFAVFLQILTLAIVTAGVLAFSYKFENASAAIFAGLLIFAVPATLAVMGIPAAKYFSLYPLYSLPEYI